MKCMTPIPGVIKNNTDERNGNMKAKRKTVTPAKAPAEAPASFGPYSEAQYNALETMKAKGLTLGAARKEFVNNALTTDGKLVKSLQSVLAAAAKASPETRAEVEAHIAEKRFLFVLDDEGLPVIYFQAHTGSNPDVY